MYIFPDIVINTLYIDAMDGLIATAWRHKEIVESSWIEFRRDIVKAINP